MAKKMVQGMLQEADTLIEVRVSSIVAALVIALACLLSLAMSMHLSKTCQFCPKFTSRLLWDTAIRLSNENDECLPSKPCQRLEQQIPKKALYQKSHGKWRATRYIVTYEKLEFVAKENIFHLKGAVEMSVSSVSPSNELKFNTHSQVFVKASTLPFETPKGSFDKKRQLQTMRLQTPNGVSRAFSASTISYNLTMSFEYKLRPPSDTISPHSYLFKYDSSGSAILLVLGGPFSTRFLFPCLDEPEQLLDQLELSLANSAGTTAAAATATNLLPNNWPRSNLLQVTIISRIPTFANTSTSPIQVSAETDAPPAVADSIQKCIDHFDSLASSTGASAPSHVANANYHVVVVDDDFLPATRSDLIFAAAGDVVSDVTSSMDQEVRSAIEASRLAAQIMFGFRLHGRGYEDFWFTECFPLYLAYVTLSKTATAGWDWEEIYMRHLVTDNRNSPAIINRNLNSRDDVIRHFHSRQSALKFVGIMRMLIGMWPATEKKFFDLLVEMKSSGSQGALDSETIINLMTSAGIEERMLRSWLGNSDYPFVDAYTNRNQQKIEVTQQVSRHTPKRFTHVRQDWIVPLFFKSRSSGSAIKKILNSTVATFNTTNLKEDEYFIINKDAIGLFRVKYKDSDMNILSKLMQNSKNRKTLSAFERANLISDSGTLTRNGDYLVSYVQTLELLDSLRFEDESIVWAAARVEIDFLRRIFTSVNDEEATKYLNSFVRKLTKSAYAGDISSLAKLSSANMANVKKRWLQFDLTHLTCDAESPKCIRSAKDNVKKDVLQLPNEAVEPFLCHGLKNKSDKVQSWVKKYLKLSGGTQNLLNHTDQRDRMIGSLSCIITSVELLDELWKKLNAEKRSTVERCRLLRGIVKRDGNMIPVVIKRLGELWAATEATHLQGESVLLEIGKVGATKTHLDLLNNFFANRDKNASNDRKVKCKVCLDAATAIRSNVLWEKAQRSKVREWLKEKFESG